MKYRIWLIEHFDPRMKKVGWTPMAPLFCLHLDEDEDIATLYGTKREAEFNRKRISEYMKDSLVAVRYRVRQYVRKKK